MILARILIFGAAAFLVVLGMFLAQPVFGVARRRPALAADPERLFSNVKKLASSLVPRDVLHLVNLNAAADYVSSEMSKAAGIEIADQPFECGRETVRNVIGSFGPKDAPVIVVGAHYDAAGGFPGADDNASGTAGLIELARLLAADPPKRTRVELVAFVNEEPPYFGSDLMGSFVHARSLVERGARVVAMLSLEMIGDFRDEPRSQEYPVPGLALVYPTRGDFVAIGGRVGDWRLTRRVKRAMSGVEGLRVRSINAPPRLAGTDLSDNWSYWRFGLPALIVTDTAFFRNHRYHTGDDVPETLDYERMARVVEGVAEAVRELADE